MADYFTYVSFIVPMNADQQAWAKADLERRENYDGDDHDNENNLDPGVDIELHPEHMWVHGHVCCLGALGDWLHGIMRHFGIDGAWTFETSSDCTKPRLDAYGGCAAIVTREDIDWMNTARWIDERLAARQLTSPQHSAPNPGLVSKDERPHPTAGYDFLI
jgi:hypothetical protein